jgi:hypothetical protein
MDNYTATETAYKNGYEDGFEAGVAKVAEMLKDKMGFNCTLVDVYECLDEIIEELNSKSI